MTRKEKRILGRVVVFSEKVIEISKLVFFIDNPRIYSAVRRKTNNPTPTQEEIFQILKEQLNVRDLINRIEHHGGILEPLIVKEGTYEVLEGNSRLAACKLLIEKYRKKSNAKILPTLVNLPCELIPEDTEDDIIFALLGELHIKGKKAWDAYEKSSYIHRRVEILMKTKSYDDSKKQVAHEAGEKPPEIETRKNIIDLMNKHDEEEIGKYSYYDVVVRTKVVQNKIENNIENEKTIINCIKTYPAQATDFRNKIKDVCKNKRASKLFFEKNRDLVDAHDVIDVPIDKILQRIIKFRDWLAISDDKINKLNTFDPRFNKVYYEYKKLFRDIEKRYEKLDKKRNIQK